MIFEGHDWELRAQVAFWTTTKSFTVPPCGFALRYTEKRREAITTAGLQFFLTYGQPPEFPKGLREKLSLYQHY